MFGQSSFAGEWVNFVEGQLGQVLQGYDAEGEPEDLRAKPLRKLYTNHTREARKLHQPSHKAAADKQVSTANV